MDKLRCDSCEDGLAKQGAQRVVCAVCGGTGVVGGVAPEPAPVETEKPTSESGDPKVEESSKAGSDAALSG